MKLVIDDIKNRVKDPAALISKLESELGVEADTTPEGLVIKFEDIEELDDIGETLSDAINEKLLDEDDEPEEIEPQHDDIGD